MVDTYGSGAIVCGDSERQMSHDLSHTRILALVCVCTRVHVCLSIKMDVNVHKLWN